MVLLYKSTATWRLMAVDGWQVDKSSLFLHFGDFYYFVGPPAQSLYAIKMSLFVKTSQKLSAGNVLFGVFVLPLWTAIQRYNVHFIRVGGVFIVLDSAHP
jgi:hypothetical protein